MFYVFPIDTKDSYDRFCYFEAAFTKEECERIVEHTEPLPYVDATVGMNESILDPSVRKSKLKWIWFNQETAWIFAKLQELVLGANKNRYGFNLSGFFESLQYTEYDSSRSHYDWHQDHGSGEHSRRKLSLVIQLSPSESYRGGVLELYGCSEIPNSQGTVIIFPSYEMHRVTPVVDGTRSSLVAWVTGPAFQ